MTKIFWGKYFLGLRLYLVGKPMAEVEIFQDQKCGKTIFQVKKNVGGGFIFGL